MSDSTEERIARLEEQVKKLQTMFDRLVRDPAWANYLGIESPQQAAQTPAVAAEPVAQPQQQTPVAESVPPKTTEREMVVQEQPSPKSEAKTAETTLADLLTARTLAFIGGGVLFLGIAFFFALAVSRGWLGEEARVVLGSLLSIGLVIAGIVIRRRHGKFEASLAAAGTGIAGCYLSVLAATALYDLVDPNLGYVLAIVVATVAVAIAVEWKSQVVAVMGLAGAMLAPPLVALDITTQTVMLLSLPVLAAGVLSVERNWASLPCLAYVLCLPQLAIWAYDYGNVEATTAVGAAVFSLFFLATGLVLRRRWAKESPAAGTVSQVLLVATLVSPVIVLGQFDFTVVCLVAASLLVVAGLAIRENLGVIATAGTLISLPQALIFVWNTTSTEHFSPTFLQSEAGAFVVLAFFWLVVTAMAYQLVLRHPGEKLREAPPTILLAGMGAALLGLSWLFDGEVLSRPSYGFAVAALALPYLALTFAVTEKRKSTRDFRTVVGALGLSLLAVAGFILLEGPLLAAVLAVESGLLALIANRTDQSRVAVASLGYAILALGYLLFVEAPPTDLFTATERPGVEILSVLFTASAALGQYLAGLPKVHSVALWIGGGLIVYAGSLGLLALLTADVPTLTELQHFDRAQTVVSTFWSLVGLGLLVTGAKTSRQRLSIAGFALMGLALGKIVLYDLASLSAPARAGSFLALGVVFLFAAFLFQRVTQSSKASSQEQEHTEGPV